MESSSKLDAYARDAESGAYVEGAVIRLTKLAVSVTASTAESAAQQRVMRTDVMTIGLSGSSLPSVGTSVMAWMTSTSSQRPKIV